MVRKKKFIYVIICLTCLLTFFTKLYWMHNAIDFTSGNSLSAQKNDLKEHNVKVPKKITVEIWGKASISIYLWKHILKGPIEVHHNGFINVGNLSTDNFEFLFKNGPGFIQTTVPKSVEFLVLVLNGRTAEHVKKAEDWLKYLKNFKDLKKVCVVLLGSEQCENDWILPHMKSKGGVVDIVFLVYDSTLVDNKEFFQWPLGVATYRGFPDVVGNSADLLIKRPFKANFVGTVYKNSSREVLTKLVKAKNWTKSIQLIERDEWIASETPETRNKYMVALESSDLTLSPVGMNTECYRIYEALSLGSIPVVENVVTPGRCQQSPPAPLRLLKQMQAPVIWITNWSQLGDILSKEDSLSFRDVTKRRIKAVKWYSNFKEKMRTTFLQVLREHFS